MFFKDKYTLHSYLGYQKKTFVNFSTVLYIGQQQLNQFSALMPYNYTTV